MPRYATGDRPGARPSPWPRSGVPLGGIGAGKVEILPDGCLTNFTHQNNWDRPLGPATGLNGIDARVGNHFAVWARARGDGACRTIARMLHTVDVAGLPRVQAIEYTGAYPISHLAYVDAELPVNVRLDAFSPVSPGRVDDSAVPAAVFLFSVTNTSSSERVEAAIMATARNTVGAWNVGRYNQALSERGIKGVVFSVDGPLPTDATAGTMCLAAPKAAGHATSTVAWNLKTADPFNVDLSNVNILPWESFSVDGTVPPIDCGLVQGEAIELAGALAVRVELGPGETGVIPIALTWHMPNSHFGHVYEGSYANAADVAADVLSRWRELFEGAKGWRNALAGVFPDWLEDALLNNLYVLSSGSWWDRAGRFALFEASRACQLMNTVDVLYYASVPLSWFYPSLSESCLRQLAAAQRPSGYIPHDLGRGRVDYPSDGTTAPPLWKDLCPKYVLMACRDVLWWGGQPLLKEMYPSVKKAMAWAMASDLDGDHLPDNEGADQTFDNWHIRGASSYTSGIYLAALLAAERMATMAEDSDFARTCRCEFELAQRSFDDQLWTGSYYRAATNDDACAAGQLNGQWYATLLGLGHILPPERVAQAVRTTVSLTGSASPHGAVNAVLPDGTADRRNPHSGNVWPGETYALASLAIYEGMVDQGLELARKVWENITDGVADPWDQPDVIDSVTGAYGFGDHYMRNMVVWAVAFALSSRDARVAAALERLKGA